MKIRLFRAAGVLAVLALLAFPLSALAHEEITAGDYIIEYGWLEEPPAAGQPNAIVFNFGAAEEHGDEEAGQISIVAPAEGTKVNGDTLDVTISIEGMDEHAMESGHWHLYVDERVITMAPLSQTTVTLTGLSNGSHTIKAVQAAADHGELGDPAQAAITVEGSSATGDPSVTEVEPMEGVHDEAGAIEVDVSGLTAEMVYGGQTVALKIEPLPDGEPGQFKADFTPERAGQYTLKLGGKLSGSLGDTEVNAEVEPEEVEPGATQTPAPPVTPQTNTTLLIVIGAVVVVVALAVGVFVMRGRKS